ncbi:MAG: hypothetical protein Q7U37_13120 [Gallionella sp.]|nr:hypothetical protein [Gallionella sp.]
MKKSADADIRNLFRRFGGDADNYQEIQQEYVDNKAAKSWPIVEAMEKERAKAPTLRASAAQQGGAARVAPASKPAVAPPVVTHHEPVAEAVRPAKQSGGLTSLFSKPEPAPARSLFSKPEPAPTRSLFSKPEPASEPALASVPARSLFSGLTSTPNAMNQQEKSKQQTASVQPVQVPYSGNDPLNSVFSRLIKPQNPVNTRTPEDGLRNMLGFLKK